MIADCLALIALAADTPHTRAFAFRGRPADPFAEAERLTVAEAFQRFTGIDLLATIDGGEGNREALAAAALGYLLHKSAQELAQPNPARAKVVFPYPEVVRD